MSEFNKLFRYLIGKNSEFEDIDLKVEVEEYQFRNPTKIIRRLNRVRRLNDLL